MMNKIVRCKVCGQVLESSESLREHEKVMTEDKKYKNHQGFDAY
jgi:transcription initiation factor IIE alpha subunit